MANMRPFQGQVAGSNPVAHSKQRKETVWMQRAKCRGLTHLFFPTGRNKGRPKKGQPKVNTVALEQKAADICNGADGSIPCPVRDQCLDYAVGYAAVQDGGVHGVWGGMRSDEIAVLVGSYSRTVVNR